MTEPNTNLPDPLKNELRALYSPDAPSAISRDRDAAILAAAHELTAHRLIAQRNPWRRLLPLSIAAALALAAGLTWFEFRPHPTNAPQVALLSVAPATAPTAATIPPYTRTGDIRDAFFLARQLKNAAPLASAWDANHDGQINDADVNALALAAVKLQTIEAGDTR